MIVRVTAQQAIYDMQTYDDLTDLLLDLNHLDAPVREGAFNALVALGAEAVPHLLGGFHVIAGSARLSVIRAFGAIRDPRAVPLLLELMQTDDPQEYVYVASFAARSLGQIRDDTALAGLIDLLVHERSGPRRMAATVLGRIGDPRAVPALIAALEHPDLQTHEIASVALHKIGTDEAVTAAEKWARAGKKGDTYFGDLRFPED